MNTMEKNFAYCVNAYLEKSELALRTNDVKIALKEFMHHIENDVVCDVVNGFTGEVLAIANDPEHENYCTEEWVLMMSGMLYFFDRARAQVEEEEDEDAPICSMCGCELDEQGVCKCCGVVDSAEPSHEMTTAEGMVLGLIQALGGLPS